MYIVLEKGQWETGHFTMFQGRRDTLLSGKQEILPSGNRTTDPLGIGPLFIWDSGHPPGKGTWETDTLSSEIRTRYPLRFGQLIIWESSSGNWEFGGRVLTGIQC